MNALSDLGHEVTAIAQQAGGSVVGIGNRWRGGSGLVVAEGRIVTNAHNLHGEAPRVFFADGREAQAQTLGVDADGDLAVLEADTGGAAALEWGDGSSLSVGAPVVALGNPAGNGVRVTFGFVSGVGRSFRGPRGRRVSGAVEHTAPLMPGSSGGPIVDVGGRLLGINTNRLGGGFYLAIAADAGLRERVTALGRGEAPRRRRLGIAVAPPHVARQLRRAVGLPELDGILVREVEPDGPAARSGIQEGDLITAAAGRPLTSVDELFDVLAGGEGRLELKLVRGSQERSVEVEA